MKFKNKYEKKALIGKGSFGNIYKVLDNENNNFYALKLITFVKNNELKNLKKAMKKKLK